ncbi:putative amidase family protein [Nitratireductor indicus C115]|uniref:Putative amidase family protein n=1 Tax=Nitratireductor indicus C115 TaxID=1231190 RepID=K2NYF0_9HYPH|nr:amidase family protein [Nitratireductor indicus]EKF44285.1 putative amidase family protein [Nitratireductor indicus C115]SFQ26781.1 amidase [Nitratireductor indicus]
MLDRAIDLGLVEQLDLAPLRHGPLDKLRFTVKDNIDIAGHKTSYGSPAWRNAHPAPVHNALCVDQLLAAGARCVGKAVADEFTYSLDGESFHFGTPRNAKAPDRIPGGSSSGSAASVANGIADFSLCTDAGGSIRVPASLCGLWGMRPSTHRISEAGVLPFQPSVSTVGVLAERLDVLDAAMRVMLNGPAAPPPSPGRIIILEDAMSIASPAVQDQAASALERIASRAGLALERVRFSEIIGEQSELSACNLNGLRDLQTAEFQSTVGNWIEACKPELGFTFSMAYGNVQRFDRIAALDRLANRERLFRQINAFFTPDTVISFPTTPTIAPRKGSLNTLEAVMAFYDPAMTITAFSGAARLPEISAPLLSVEHCPVGLSFVAGNYQDEFLLNAVREMLI